MNIIFIIFVLYIVFCLYNDSKEKLENTCEINNKPNNEMNTEINKKINCEMNIKMNCEMDEEYINKLNFIDDDYSEQNIIDDYMMNIRKKNSKRILMEL